MKIFNGGTFIMLIKIIASAFLFVTISTGAMELTIDPIDEEKSLTVELDPIEGVSKKTKFGFQPRSLKEIISSHINQPLLDQFYKMIPEEESVKLCQNWLQGVIDAKVPEEINHTLFCNLLRDTKASTPELEQRKEALCDRLLKQTISEPVKRALLSSMATHDQSFSRINPISKGASIITKICTDAQQQKLQINLAQVNPSSIQRAFKTAMRENKTELCKYLIENNANLNYSPSFKGVWYYAINSFDLGFVDYLIAQKTPIQDLSVIFDSLNFALQRKDTTDLARKALLKIATYQNWQIKRFLDCDKKGSQYLISRNPIHNEQLAEAIHGSYVVNDKISISKDLQSDPVLSKLITTSRSLAAELNAKKRSSDTIIQ